MLADAPASSIYFGRAPYASGLLGTNTDPAAGTNSPYMKVFLVSFDSLRRTRTTLKLFIKARFLRVLEPSTPTTGNRGLCSCRVEFCGLYNPFYQRMGLPHYQHQFHVYSV